MKFNTIRLLALLLVLQLNVLDAMEKRETRGRRMEKRTESGRTRSIRSPNRLTFVSEEKHQSNYSTQVSPEEDFIYCCGCCAFSCVGLTIACLYKIFDNLKS